MQAIPLPTGHGSHMRHERRAGLGGNHLGQLLRRPARPPSAAAAAAVVAVAAAVVVVGGGGDCVEGSTGSVCACVRAPQCLDGRQQDVCGVDLHAQTLPRHVAALRLRKSRRSSSSGSGSVGRVVGWEMGAGVGALRKTMQKQYHRYKVL